MEPMDIDLAFAKLDQINQKKKLSLRDVAAYTGKDTQQIYTDVKIVGIPHKV